MKKITGFACATVPEGQAINYVYSTIEDGRIIEKNVRGTIIVDDEADVLAAISTINTYLGTLIQ